MPDPRNADPRLLAGPALFVILWILPRPAGMSGDAQAVLAVAAWMAAWWLTVAVPLAVTALLPLVAFPVLGVFSPAEAAAPYADPVIFLFMGGFFIAMAMQRWELHRRVALGIVARTGTTPRRLVAGFMAATALLSMWMSNTAASLMMMPIGVAVLTVMTGPGGPGRKVAEGPGASARQGEIADRGAMDGQLDTALMLGIAYAASIGGTATLIGTPPNAILAGVARRLEGVDVSFAEWMQLGVPISAVMLVGCWALLCWPLYRLSGRPVPGAERVLDRERAKLGGWSRPERVTAVVFASAAAAWVFRAPKEIGDVTVPGIESLFPQVGDATIAMAAALALFLWPARDDRGRRTRVLDWEHARSIPWDILVLFGGGLSLASAFESSGLTSWLGGVLVVFSGLPEVLVIGAVAALFILLTEVTSNTATATLGLPVVAGLAPSIGMAALPLMAAAALAASMAFMLPVATPPNAIVFGSGRIDALEMRRAGLWMNLLSLLVITLAIVLAGGVLA